MPRWSRPCRHVRAGFHNFARRKDLPVPQHGDAGAVAAVLVGPHPRGVCERICEILRTVIAVSARAVVAVNCRKLAVGVEERIEPISRLLDL
jgi:hypothetical protein